MTARNTNPKIQDLEKLFQHIPPRYASEQVVFGSSDVDIDPNSHVQGVAVTGQFIIFTHSDARWSAGLYLLAENGNLVARVRLPVVRSSPPFLNHSGGCQRIGDYLVIPNEAIFDPLSRVSFFDISDPFSPNELTSPAPIDRKSKAGAAGIANVTIGGVEYWFLAVYDNGHVDFYKSDGNPFPNTQFQSVSGEGTDVLNGYQSFCLVASTDDRLYAMGFRLDGRLRDWVDVYEVLLETGDLNPCATRQFITNGARTVHFRWGAGIDIVSATECSLFSTGHLFTRFNYADTADVRARAELERIAASVDVSGGPRCNVNFFPSVSE
jgi:hypothetical protein